MSKFNEVWKTTTVTTDMLADEAAGEQQYREAAQEASTPEEQAVFEEMAADEAKHHDMLVEMQHNSTKQMKEFMKPGETPHSAKWDACVAQVKQNNPGVNAYAVCTAQLGEESFKSQFRKTPYAKTQIKKAVTHVIYNELGDMVASWQDPDYLDAMEVARLQEAVAHKFNITGAGAVPQSLLAEQDLEDTTSTKTVKASVEQTAKKLDTLVDKAKDAESTEEKDELIDKIKANQIKSQKAVIDKRKSFKELWNNLK